jgi:hypothetical protein
LSSRTRWSYRRRRRFIRMGKVVTNGLSNGNRGGMQIHGGVILRAEPLVQIPLETRNLSPGSRPISINPRDMTISDGIATAVGLFMGSINSRRNGEATARRTTTTTNSLRPGDNGRRREVG